MDVFEFESFGPFDNNEAYNMVYKNEVNFIKDTLS